MYVALYPREIGSSVIGVKLFSLSPSPPLPPPPTILLPPFPGLCVLSHDHGKDVSIGGCGHGPVWPVQLHGRGIH